MKIGIITYHAAYNFGSVLQAYATQIMLEQMGYETQIINYRPKSQKRFYGIVCTGNGYRRFMKSLIHLVHLKKRLIRKDKYESFISRRMKTTEEFSNPLDAKEYSDRYNIYLSGSDQIWNKHSHELYNMSWDYMDPYLLTFTDKPKISYASSINNTTEEELINIIPKVRKFSSISCREEKTSQMLCRLLNRDVATVLDPTMMINREKWLSLVPQDRIINDEYILYYSLRGIDDIKKDITKLHRFNIKIIIICPLSPISSSKDVINFVDAGPEDFLRLIRDAKCIFTASYHGLLFSVNFNKDFYAIKSKNPSQNLRAINILSKIHMEERLIDDIESINIDNERLSFASANEAIYKMREKSKSYLEKSIAMISK